MKAAVCLNCEAIHVLMFTPGHVGGLTSALQLVSLFLASFMIAWSTQESVCLCVCVHAQLFVAGLVPWEPILHLSVSHSPVPPSPNFTLNLPAADPFFYFLVASLIPSLALSLTLSLLSPLSDQHTHTRAHAHTPIKNYLYSPYALSHTKAHFHTSTLCPDTRIDWKWYIYAKWQRAFGSQKYHQLKEKPWRVFPECWFLAYKKQTIRPSAMEKLINQCCIWWREGFFVSVWRNVACPVSSGTFGGSRQAIHKTELRGAGLYERRKKK